MTILGIGTDLCDIRRIEAAYAKFGERFLLRVFTPIERARALRYREKSPTMMVASLAKRFAAKEACAKALGTGFRQGVALSQIGVESLPSGQPGLVLTGGAAARLKAMTPAGFTPSLALTMTDEYPIAQAFVVISAVKLE